MIVKKYRSKLININNTFEGIYTLEFESLNGAYKYYPGQFLHLALDKDYDGTGQWPESRCFSMQSNPDQKTIRITYAVKGRYTKQMNEELQIGSEVWLKLPYGELFSQPHNKVDTVFIAGGTGITPFLSLFNDYSFKEYKNPKIYLGFRSELHNIYQEELKILKPFKVNVTYEKVDGRLDINKIYSENGIGSDYFISGPPEMIKIFKKTLISNGVFRNRVLTDEWE